MAAKRTCNTGVPTGTEPRFPEGLNTMDACFICVLLGIEVFQCVLLEISLLQVFAVLRRRLVPRPPSLGGSR